jgi:hypothetical protein
MYGSSTRQIREDALTAAARRHHREYATAKKVAQPCSDTNFAAAHHGGACPNCGYDPKLSARQLEESL